LPAPSRRYSHCANRRSINSPFERRVRLLPGRFEVPPGAGRVAGAAVELAERGVEQVIAPQGRVPAGLVQGWVSTGSFVFTGTGGDWWVDESGRVGPT
jgi:hypothetical protein